MTMSRQCVYQCTEYQCTEYIYIYIYMNINLCIKIDRHLYIYIYICIWSCLIFHFGDYLGDVWCLCFLMVWNGWHFVFFGLFGFFCFFGAVGFLFELFLNFESLECLIKNILFQFWSFLLGTGHRECHIRIRREKR